MPKFKIFAGLEGEFCVSRQIGVYEFRNKNEAFYFAIEKACEIYDSYVGHHGLRTPDQIAWEEGLDPTGDREEIQDIYDQERENWITFLIEQVNDEDDAYERELSFLDENDFDEDEEFEIVRDEP